MNRRCAPSDSVRQLRKLAVSLLPNPGAQSCDLVLAAAEIAFDDGQSIEGVLEAFTRAALVAYSIRHLAKEAAAKASGGVAS